ncbi:MAG: tetratricopeptide repeat protein [Myxococcota bacterium]
MRVSEPEDLDATLAGEGVPLPEPATPRRGPGSRVDRYVIMAKIGAGTTGSVYSAFDPELDRKLAIKLLHPGSSPRRAQRARKEAKALAKVNSPNVVSVFDVGRVGDETFIAMEFVDGQTLDQWLEREAGGWRSVLGVFIGAGRGLAAAHAAGLVHGDFKPANVMVDRSGHARVLDFGRARPAQNESAVDSGDTPAPSDSMATDGGVMGTPAYMSPEQVLQTELSPRSDQFSFCVALWEGLFGERPFRGERFFELAAALLEQRPEPPAKRNAVPTWLVRALLRGLSREPSERWPAMDTLLRELTRNRVRRRTTIAVGLAVVGSLGAWGLAPAPSERARCQREANEAMRLWSDERASALREAIEGSGEAYASDVATGVVRQVGRYTDAWRTAYEETCTASRKTLPDDTRYAAHRCLDERRRELDTRLSALVHEEAKAALHGAKAIESLPRIWACTDVAYLAVAGEGPADPEVAVATQTLTGKIAEIRSASAVGRYRAAHELAREVVDEADALSYRPISAAAHLALGQRAYTLGDLDESRRHLRHAYRSSIVAERARLSILSALALARLEGLQGGKPEQGREWAYHADAHLERPGVGPSLRVQYHSVLGLIDSQDQRPEDAIRHFEQALELTERIDGPGTLTAAKLDFNLAAQLRRQGQYERALPLLERGLQTHLERLGEHHPELSMAHNNYAATLISLGRTADATGHLERAVAIAERSLPGRHPNLAYTFTNLTRAHLDGADLEQALAANTRALTLRESSLPADHPHIGYTLVDQADVLRRLRRFDEAHEALQRAMALAEQREELDHPSVIDPLIGQGRLLVARDRPADAIAPLQRALELMPRPAAEYEDGKKAITEITLARAQWLTDQDRADAEVRARAALQVLAAEPSAKGGVLARDLERMKDWFSRP